MAALILSLVLLLAASPALAEAPDAISFRPQAEVLNSEMTLGELANLSGRCTAWADVPMGRSPEPGHTLALERREILNRLAVAVPRQSARIDCPEQVLALRRHQVVTRAQMVEALKAQLAHRFGAQADEVSLSGFRVAEEPQVPEGALSLVYELPESNDRLLGTLNLALEVRVDGTTCRKLRPGATVALRRSVVCAARQIGRYEVLGPDDVELAPREVDSLEPLTSLDEALGKRVGRRIEAGAVLARRDLDEPPVLSRGDTVTITLTSGPLSVTTRGTARQGGRVGEIVRVVNNDSKRELEAVIVDASTVRVPFER